MIHLLRGALGRLVYGGMVALVLVAILISVLRLSLPLTDGLREPIAAALSKRLGHPVQVGDLSLRLAGWSPRLRLDDAVIGDSGGGEDVLRLQALEVDVDLVRSLREGELEVRALTLVGARLTARLRANGRIRIEGLAALETADPKFLRRFLRRGRLSLEDSEVQLVIDRLPHELPRLTDVRLRLDNVAGRHRLELSAHPATLAHASPGSDSADASLRLSADLEGEALDPSGWEGSLYLNLSAADLSGLLPPPLLEGHEAATESLVIESWLRLRAGALAESLVRFAARGVRLPIPAPLETASPESESPESAPGAEALAGGGQHHGMMIDRLGGLLRLSQGDPVPAEDTHSAGGWRIGLRDLALSIGRKDLPDLDLDLRLGEGGRPEWVTLATGRFDLELLQRVTELYPKALPPTLIKALARHPRGHVERLALNLAYAQGAAARWRIAAAGEGLGIDQAESLPGIEGLSAQLRADQDGGTLRLGSETLRLDLAPAFDRILTFDQFSAVLGWTRVPDGGLRLNGRSLHVENGDLSARARFSLDLPAAGDAAAGPFLDLRARLRDGNGGNIRPYLPVGILHPDLTRWLSRAVVDGDIPQADLILRGPLKDYPFREHQGRFELLLELEGGVLDYLEGWPRIEAISGRLHFLDQGLDIQVSSGRILNSALEAAQAEIPDLWDPPRIRIQGETEGPLADGLRILGETPLAAQLGPLARSLEADGGSHLVLDLDVPLARGEPLRADGRITWPGPAEIGLKGTPLRLTDLDGALDFTVDSLSAEAISAQLWGRPVTLTIATGNAGDPDAAVTRIGSRGRSPVTELAARLPSPAWVLVGGDLDWTLGVDLRLADLRRAKPTLDLQLDSRLSGLTLDLPAPLGKTAAETRPLALSGSLVPGESLALQGTVGDLGLDLDLSLAQGPRLKRGRVRLGSAAPPAEAPGLVVDGALDRLDLEVWTDWWKVVRPRLLPGTSDATPGAEPFALTYADLRVAELRLGEGRLTDAQVRAVPQDDGWDLRLESKELSGRLNVPPRGSGAPLDIGLERLDLRALVGSEDSAEPGAPGASGRHREPLPALDLRVADLRWGDAGLGRLSLTLRPELSGLRLPHLELRGPGDTRLTGDATWTDGEGGGRSRATVELESADTGLLLRALDYAPVLSAAPLTAKAQLNWPGGLTDFAPVTSDGRIEAQVGAGRILALEPGVGRVLGFFNLGALSRRLTLDFTDIYERGFSFERMDADIRVGDGQAELRRFDIEGPASTIHANGFTDLRARTFNQTVTVEPRIGSSVALATAVAGGPVAGAAVYLVDKVIGGAIDKLGSYQYQVTGPWSDPELKRLGWEPFANQAPTGPPASDSPGTGAQGVEEPGLARPRAPDPTLTPEPREQNLFLD